MGEYAIVSGLCVGLLLVVGGMVDAQQLEYPQLVAKRILVDQKVFRTEATVPAVIKDFGTALRASPELGGLWQERDLIFIQNMVFTAAAEMAMGKAIVGAGQVRLPAEISDADFRLGVLQWDTLPTRSCGTPARIREGRYGLGDVVMYIGDLDKLVGLVGRDADGVRKLSTANEVIKTYETLIQFEEKRVGVLLGSIVDSKYLKVKALLWNIRANLVSGRDERTTMVEAEKLVKVWALDK